MFLGPVTEQWKTWIGAAVSNSTWKIKKHHHYRVTAIRMNTLPAWTLLTSLRRAWKGNSSESSSYKPHKAKRCSSFILQELKCSVFSLNSDVFLCLDPPDITVTSLYRRHRFTAFSRINNVQLWWDYCLCLGDFPWMFFTLVSLCLILVLLPPADHLSSCPPPRLLIVSGGRLCDPPKDVAAIGMISNFGQTAI